MSEIDKPSFLTSNIRPIFTQLRQVFTKALILQHLDCNYHI